MNPTPTLRFKWITPIARGSALLWTFAVACLLLLLLGTPPVRAASTFTDADWVSLSSGLPGADNPVNAIISDKSGNTYVGGDFTVIGGIVANRIAKWDGTSWSALGGGITQVPNSRVYALALIGNDLYAGGSFTNAGGVAATNIAKWDGTNWTAVGPGLGGTSMPWLRMGRRSMPAGTLRMQALWRLITSPNGTAARGPLWAREPAAQELFWRWQSMPVSSMPADTSPARAGYPLIILRAGTEAPGRRWAQD